MQLQRHTALTTANLPGKPDFRAHTRILLNGFAAMFPTGTPKERHEFVHAHLVQFKEQIDNLPSPYENPLDYAILTDLADAIRTVATEELAHTERDLPDWPLIGTMDSGSVNAVTFRVPNTNEHIIVFEKQLIRFALLLSKAIAQAFPSKPGENGEENSFSTAEEDIVEYLDANPVATERFAQVVTAYVLDGVPGAAPQYYPDNKHAGLAGILRHSLELFVFGHEYAHVLAGHLADADVRHIKRADITEDELRYSWEKELEADLIGIQLSMMATHKTLKVDASFSYSGADFFFGAIDIVDRALTLVRSGQEVNYYAGTHPPSDQRRKALRTFLPRILEEDQAAAAISLGEVIEFVIEELWRRIRPFLVNLHKRGIPVSPRWTALEVSG